MKKKVSIIGSGACALALALELNTELFEITIYEKSKSAGRKFLVAGQGGLNITHSESPTSFIEKYTPKIFLEKAFQQFSNIDFINWLDQLGIETFVGSSKRIFPVSNLKPIQVLNILLDKIKTKKIRFLFEHEWAGFNETKLLFKTPKEKVEISSDFTVFCLGGASWHVTGSDGSWKDFFKTKGVQVNNFEASNCTFLIHWPEILIPKLAGKSLKNISISCHNVNHLGEITFTAQGIEGSGVYPLSPQIRADLKANNGKAILNVDLKPSLSKAQLVEKINKINAKNNYTEQIKREINLPSFLIQLLKFYLTKEEFLNAETLAEKIKSFPLVVYRCGAITEAISTVGGIDLNEIDENFQIKKLPQHFAIGEMLDYDAPTGGYLLQSCFTMGVVLARKLNNIF
ncbi:MAG: TIGR03862 family flavoprotein [Sphingobacteriaceae bacterium]|nr:TIGR03862 family flavoprotein [Sphingobacteriaceae bacterium]